MDNIVTKCISCESSDIIHYMDSIHSKIKCNNCKSMFFVCNLCGDLDLDYKEEPYKGVNCESCQKVFCMSCWEHTGRFGPDKNNENNETDDINEDNYNCEKCLKKK